MTWRASDELVQRVQSAAQRSGRSMNQFLTVVLDAATDPEAETDQAVRVRERLARANLLAAGDRSRPYHADPAPLSAARIRAGQGVSLVDLVISERE